MHPLSPVLGSRRASASLFAHWHDLAADAPPFMQADFVRLTARLERMDDAWLFAARAGARFTAALPLVRRDRTLLAVRGEHTPRFDVTGDPRTFTSLWEAIRDAEDWDRLELRSVPADSLLATRLPELARRDGFTAVVRETHRSPWFCVDGIEDRVHRRFRGDMRRLERQLGGVELERIARYDHDALRDVLRLEAAAWKGAAGTAIACDRRIARFYAGVARVFAARGALTMAFLRARGARIAALFALEDATTFYLMKTGYDPAFAHYGPGQLLVRESAADAARRGLVRYDLMGRDTPWKAKWTDQARPHVEVLVYAPTLRGRAAHFVRHVARPLAGRAMRALKSR
jgi:CelD/BcsL family acetyltransferase involved in cellulose biosynthesis